MNEVMVFDNETQVFLQEREQIIGIRAKRMNDDIVEIGLALLEVRDHLDNKYGEYRGRILFGQWAESKVPFKRRAIGYFIQIVERWGNSIPVSAESADLGFVALSELVNASDTIVERVQSGEVAPSYQAIREAKRAEKNGQYIEGETQEVPFFEQWQKDNVELGLTPLGDPQPGPIYGTTSTLGPNTPREITSFPPPLLQNGTYRNTEEQKEWTSQREARDLHVMQVMGSSDSPEWYTPQEIVRLSVALFGEIELDPCSNSQHAPNVPAKKHYTREDNGLILPWEGKVYLNPPYGSEISLWVAKLVNSYGRGVTEAVALLPARIDTQWFQPLYEETDCLMCHVRGRIQFENSPHHAPFPCIIAYLGKRETDFIRLFKQKGPIMRRIA